MSTHFCLAISLLDRTFHGRLNRGEAEWPPSPARAYQALVAAAAARACGGPLLDSVRGALEWLEHQPAPLIVAPAASTTSIAYRASVPNNAMDVVARAWSRGNYTNTGDASPATHRTMKTIRRTYLFSDGAIYYLWPLPENEAGPQNARDLLSEIASSILALGWGLDLAVGHGEILTADQVERLPGEHWLPVPDGTGAADLRVPRAGTLADLINRHRRLLARLGPDGLAPPPPFTAYRTVAYRRAFDPPPCPYAAFHLLHPDSEKAAMRPFDPVRHTLTVAHMMRHAVAAAARFRWSEDEVARTVMGHGEPRDADMHRPPGNRRFSFLPLPTIVFRGPDIPYVVGSSRRVMLSSCDPDFGEPLTWARQAMPGRELISLREPDHPLALLSAPQFDSVVRRYIDPTATWSTVTPLVLPGYDDPDNFRRRLERGLDATQQKDLLNRLDTRIDGLIRKAVIQAGMPAALADHALIDWRPGGFFPGVDLARRYTVPNYLKRFPRMHVRITWRDAAGRQLRIRGPICLGGGRFFGLGLLAGMN